MSEYFREPKSTVGRVKVELDLSNYCKIHCLYLPIFWLVCD